jgi:hypothetical protein
VEELEELGGLVVPGRVVEDLVDDDVADRLDLVGGRRRRRGAQPLERAAVGEARLRVLRSVMRIRERAIEDRCAHGHARIALEKKETHALRAEIDPCRLLRRHQQEAARGDRCTRGEAEGRRRA